MRKIYASRAEAFAESAQRHWQGVIDVPEIRAGLDITCNLQMDNEQAAFARLQAAGIDTMPLARYCVQPRGPGLVLGFAPYDERAIEDAAKAVAVALRQ
ncbi:hypothetical protein D3C78_1631060 [compost metagenome]